MAKTNQHRKGRWEYGRRVKSSGGPVPRKTKRAVQRVMHGVEWNKARGNESAPAEVRILPQMTDRKVYGPFH